MILISHWKIVFMTLIVSNLAQDTIISTSTESAITNGGSGSTDYSLPESTNASTANNSTASTSPVNFFIPHTRTNSIQNVQNSST